MNYSGVAYECSLLMGADSLKVFRAEWADLHCRVINAHLSEGVDWAEVCWRTRAALGGQRLLCLVVRRGTQLVAILPLVVSRRAGFRIARPLACQTTEYCPLLADPSADALSIWTAMAGAIRSMAGVDAVVLPNVREDAALAGFLNKAPRVLVIDRIPVWFLHRSAFDSWDSYWRQRPSRMKSNVRRARCGLEQLGEVRVEELADPDARREAWEWMISHKRDWLVRKGLDHAFVPTEEYARFTEATLDISALIGRRAIFVLKLNGKILAAEMVNVDRRRVEAFVCTYDPAFSRYGLGNLLRQEMIRWAFAQGFDYDWRLGDEPYKPNWATQRAMATTYVLARNPWGRLFSAYLAARTWLAYRAPSRLRREVRNFRRTLHQHCSAVSRARRCRCP